MDEKEKRIQDLHRRRREVLAQELKAYLSPPEDTGLWAAISGQPAFSPGPRRPGGRVLRFPRRNS